MYRKIVFGLMLASVYSSLAAETLLDCAKIEDPAERVACYDKVAGRVEKKMEAPQTGTTEERIEARNLSVAEEVVGGKNEPPPVDSVEIKSVLRDRNRRVTYVMVDGRRFKRSTSERVTFKSGDKLTIEDGLFGSKFLVRDDGQRNKVSETR
jgi:hypothetical protein